MSISSVRVLVPSASSVLAARGICVQIAAPVFAIISVFSYFSHFLLLAVGYYNFLFFSSNRFPVQHTTNRRGNLYAVADMAGVRSVQEMNTTQQLDVVDTSETIDHYSTLEPNLPPRFKLDIKFVA